MGGGRAVPRICRDRFEITPELTRFVFEEASAEGFRLPGSHEALRVLPEVGGRQRQRLLLWMLEDHCLPWRQRH